MYMYKFHINFAIMKKIAYGDIFYNRNVLVSYSCPLFKKIKCDKDLSNCCSLKKQFDSI